MTNIALTQEEITAFLAARNFGHLGCTDGTTPYVFPMAYGFVDDVLYGQTTKGKKIDIVHHNSTVCFQVDEVQADQWISVMCWGTLQELDFSHLESKQQVYLARVLSERLATVQHQFGVHIEHNSAGGLRPGKIFGKESVLFRIPIETMSGIRHPIG